MSSFTQRLINAFTAIPQWLLEQQADYNEDQARTSPHTRGRAVSASIAAKRRHAAKKKRQAAKLARRRHRFGRKAKPRKQAKRKKRGKRRVSNKHFKTKGETRR